MAENASGKVQAPDKLFSLLFAVIGGAAAFAVVLYAILLCFRYDFAAAGNEAVAYRFDRWTGEATVCLPQDKNPLRLICSGRPSDFIHDPEK